MKKTRFIIAICLLVTTISLACAPLSRDTQATEIAGSIFAALTEEAPTETPEPTETPLPTETSTPTSTPPLPTETPIPLPTNTPIPTGVVGTWMFAPRWADSDVRSEPFKITFHEDGSLTYYWGSDPSAEGKWEEQGRNIEFDINDYSFWEGAIEADRMSGTMYNEGGLEGTWIAIRDFIP